MDQNKLNYYKDMILKRQNEVFEDLKNSKKKESLKDSTGDNPYSYHMADQGSDSFELEKSFMFNSIEGEMLKEMDEALERIRTDTFGICVACSEEINKPRLEAIPYAKLCLECKAKEELE